MSEQDEARGSRKLQYGIGSLLIVTALAAALLAVGARLGWSDIYFLLLLALLFAGSGYIAGWLGRGGVGSVQGIFIPASIFIALNWVFWFLNRWALWFVSEATGRNLNSILQAMLDAHKGHVFDGMAVIITIAVVVAAMKRRRAFVFLAGTISTLVWFLLVVLGYLSASVCLVDI